jgi:hypothetical protein
MRRTIIFAAASLLALLDARSAPAAPQPKGTSTLTGVVLGPDDKPVPRASVTYQSSAGTGPHAIYTNSKGRFTITRLHADNYDLRASSKGLCSEWEKNVTLGKGQTRELTLQLLYSREMPETKARKP